MFRNNAFRTCDTQLLPTKNYSEKHSFQKNPNFTRNSAKKSVFPRDFEGAKYPEIPQNNSQGIIFALSSGQRVIISKCSPSGHKQITETLQYELPVPECQKDVRGKSLRARQSGRGAKAGPGPKSQKKEESLWVRTSSTTTRDRFICNFGAPSPLETLRWIFCFFSSIYVQFSRRAT